MKELHFTYRMKLSFDAPVKEHRFTLKCVPCSSVRQEILDLEIDVYPKEFLAWDTDSFGNTCIYGYAKEEHDHFSAEVTGRARTGLTALAPAGGDHQVGMYRYQTDYTKPGPCIRSFAREFSFAEGTGSLEKAKAYMDGLYGRFQYVQGVTDITTTAEQALVLGQGVCQDYSHI